MPDFSHPIRNHAAHPRPLASRGSASHLRSGRIRFDLAAIHRRRAGTVFQFTATVTGGGTNRVVRQRRRGRKRRHGNCERQRRLYGSGLHCAKRKRDGHGGAGGSPQQNYATAVVSIIVPGQVSCPSDLGNPQVAQYSLYLPAPGKMDVQFGTTTGYGLVTWQVPTPSANGGETQIYVAGMRDRRSITCAPR